VPPGGGGAHHGGDSLFRLREGRQARGRREPITARMVADLLQAVGVAHVVTVDVHTPQIEGFFHAPVDSLTAVPVLCQALREGLPRDAVVVSPDAGRANLAAQYARCLGIPVVLLHKRRGSGADVEVTTWWETWRARPA